MNIVADTNIYLAVALDEPEKGDVVTLTAGAALVAPEILPYEIGNALSALIKRHKLTISEALDAFEVTQSIPVKLVTVDIRRALTIAEKYNLYAYDAFFLQCALKAASPLLTLDGRMKDVAKSLNIQILE